MSTKLDQLQELAKLLLDDEKATHMVSYEDRHSGDIERGYYLDVNYVNAEDDPRNGMPKGYGNKRDSYLMKVAINGDYLGYSFQEAKQSLIGYVKDRLRMLEGSELHLKQRILAADAAITALNELHDRHGFVLQWVIVNSNHPYYGGNKRHVNGGSEANPYEFEFTDYGVEPYKIYDTYGQAQDDCDRMNAGERKDTEFMYRVARWYSVEPVKSGE